MINNVVLMGRLTASPELKETQSGANVVSFTLAVDRRYQQAGAEKQTDFINCVSWRNTAEFISKYFKKGDMIAVTGEIQTRRFEHEGKNRTATEIVVNNASFCGGKNNNETKEDSEIYKGFGDSEIDINDLPF